MSAETFFFLRPYWLLMLIPLVALVTVYARRARLAQRSAWHDVVDQHLLNHLVVKSAKDEQPKWRLTAFAVAMAASVVALAGPTWERNELPVFEAHDPTVLVLSLAQSMNATDLSPNRLTRAGHKVRDLLDDAKGGDFGLIIYADQPFVAAPLTSDTRVIKQMLPELSTSLMPVLGNRLELAIGRAQGLLQQADARRGRIVVIADDAGVAPKDAVAAARAAADAGYTVSVLGAGTARGADMRTATGMPIKDRNGQQAVTRLASADLAEIAHAGGGAFTTLSPGNADIRALLPDTAAASVAAQRMNADLRADTWNDMGYWLLIIPIVLAPFAFRRNVLMAIPVGLAISIGAPAPQANAATWDELWQTPDQLGAHAFQSGEFDRATEAFEDPRWRASALYKAGRYGEAARAYAGATTASDYYNHGNALARAGDLEQAIAAYDEALKQTPGDSDVKFNRELVEKLLQEQQREQEQQGEGQQDQAQSGAQQDSSQGEGQQQQAQGDGQQEPSQGEGQQQQAQGDAQQEPSQGEGQQQQAQGDAQQEPSQGEGQQQQALGDAQQEPSQGDGQQRDGAERTAGTEPANNTASAAQDDGKSAFRQAMDALLRGNGQGTDADREPGDEDPQPQASAGGISELDQALEQRLRAVPDDPSGLLRARIRQHYARLRANN